MNKDDRLFLKWIHKRLSNIHRILKNMLTDCYGKLCILNAIGEILDAIEFRSKQK